MLFKWNKQNSLVAFLDTVKKKKKKKKKIATYRIGLYKKKKKREKIKV
jgi:hypothetical protein